MLCMGMRTGCVTLGEQGALRFAVCACLQTDVHNESLEHFITFTCEESQQLDLSLLLLLAVMLLY